MEIADPDSDGYLAAAGRRLRFREAQPEDVPELSRLFTSVFGSPMTPELWRWKYRRFAAVDAINVVGCTEDGRIRAHMGAQVFLDPWVRGSVSPWIHGCDVMVDPAVRGSPSLRGAYGGIVRALQHAIDDCFPGGFCYGFPGERPHRLGERLGFYRPLHRISLASLRLGAIRHRRRLWPRLGSLATTEELADLSKTGSERGVQRTADYLRWRYDAHPGRSYGAWVWRAGWRRHEGIVIEEAADSWTVVDILGHPVLDTAPLFRLAFAAQRVGRTILRWDADWTPHGFAGAEAQSTGIVAVWIRTPKGRNEASGLRLRPADTDVF